MIQDGSYVATMTGAQVRLTTQQKLMIVFEWKLAASGLTIRSYSVVSNPDGSLNPKPIQYIQRWCPGWDGKDPYWFEEHLAELQSIEVRLSIRNEPDYRDSSKTVSKVSWVNPLHWDNRCAATRIPRGEAESRSDALAGVSSGEAEKPLTIEELGKALNTPDSNLSSSAPQRFAEGALDLNLIHPSMNECWGAFAKMCDDAHVSNARRDALWIAEMASLIPGRDQIDFDESDWSRVISWLKLAKDYKMVA